MVSISRENEDNLRSSSDDDDETCLSTMFLTSIQVFPAVLKAAIDLKLFDIIATKASPLGTLMTAREVASHLPYQQSPHISDRVERVLRFLASYDILTHSSSANGDDEGTSVTRYGLSSIGKNSVSDESGGGAYMASLTTYLSYKALLPIWMNFKEAVVDPEADMFKKIHGKSIYEYCGMDSEFNDILNNAMSDLCASEMKRVLELYKGFEGITTLVDVGGGIAQNLKIILSKYPSIHAINFDRPQVIHQAKAIPGIEHIGGDMFVSIPKGDAIVLKKVCHNWSDEKCIEILSKCHEALPENGKVIMIEYILPESPEATKASKLVSALDNMMFITQGGRVRTEKQYNNLGKLSGFSMFQVACRAFSALGVMEFYK